MTNTTAISFARNNVISVHNPFKCYITYKLAVFMSFLSSCHLYWYYIFQLCTRVKSMCSLLSITINNILYNCCYSESLVRGVDCF